MNNATSKKLLLSSLALLALGALFTRNAMADAQPAPVATWESLFGSDIQSKDDDSAWDNLVYSNGYGGASSRSSRGRWGGRSFGFNQAGPGSGGGAGPTANPTIQPIPKPGNGSGTKFKGGGGLIVGVSPPPISPWKP